MRPAASSRRQSRRSRSAWSVTALYTLSDDRAWLVGVQLLDGIGAGIFGAIYPVIVSDLMRNTGGFNVAQGVIILTLAAIAAIGFIVFLLAFRGKPGDVPLPSSATHRGSTPTSRRNNPDP